MAYKTKSPAGGGRKVQGAPLHKENGVTRTPPVLNGIVDPSEGFRHIGEGERAMSNSRPSATCNSSTFEDRRHSDAASTAACSRVYRRSVHQPAEPTRSSSASSSAVKFVDSRTTPIVRLLFHRTFTQANLDKDVIRRLDIEPIVRRLSPTESSFVRDTCDKYLEYIRICEPVSVDSHRRAIETAGWDVTDNNVYVEFKKVVNETFDENVTWGSVIGFLGFALGFSVFIHNRGMKRAVISVAEWTKQVIEEDIGNFFLKNNGWVS